MATKQRGSGWSIKLVFTLYKVFGYNFIYYLMYPVSFFYFIFASNVRKSLKIYYEHLEIKFTNLRYYEHLRMFAITMVDRFITKADPNSYTFYYDDAQQPLEIMKDATILLQSHFGGWASSPNVSRIQGTIYVVMQEALLDSIKEIEESIDYKTNISVIDLNRGQLSVSIQIANALMDKGVVAMMGDRASNANGVIYTKFFGQSACFNKNPFQIAYKMDVPILLYFVLFEKKQVYKFEYIPIYLDKTKNEAEAIEEALELYVKTYEKFIRQYPNQWFNFYDFWNAKEKIA